MMLLGLVGAFACLLLLVLINRRNGFQPERILLSGIAITALFEPLQAIALANGDLRVQQTALLDVRLHLLRHPAGGPCPGGVGAADAGSLPAGEPLARSHAHGACGSDGSGIHLGRAQLTILLLVAVLTASATMVIGPPPFAGLLAPHLARLMGLVRARWHLLGAAGCGALLMVSADWIGQQILFPQEVPVGLVSTLLGALTSCGACAASRLVDESAPRMNPGFSLPALRIYLPMQNVNNLLSSIC